MSLKLPTYWLIILLLLVSCRKNKNTIIVEGVLLNPVTNTSVGGISVDLSSQQPVSGTFSIAYNTLDKQTTDATGKFRFEFKNSNASSYRLRAEHPDYYFTEETKSPSAFPVGEVTNLILPFYAKGVLKINVRNVNPFDGDDKLVYQIATGAVNKLDFCFATTQTFTGMSVDTSLSCLNYGYQKVVLKWFRTKNNVITSFVDSLVIPLNDTAIYSILY
ncbi:MAG: hypothetical protein ACK4K0_03750 [Flavobacteriales bacterium]